MRDTVTKELAYGDTGTGMTKELATMNRKELVGMASLTRYKVYRFYTEQFTLGGHHYMEKDQRETGTELTKELASWSSPGD